MHLAEKIPSSACNERVETPYGKTKSAIDNRNIHCIYGGNFKKVYTSPILHACLCRC